MTVIWTKRALKTFFEVADYLQKEWGTTVVESFTAKAQKVIEQIENAQYVRSIHQIYECKERIYYRTQCFVLQSKTQKKGNRTLDFLG